MRAITRSVTVHRPVDEVRAAVSRPADVMAVVGEFGRTAPVGERDDGPQVWEVFIVIGTMYVGGKVQVEVPADGELAWHSISGIRSSAHLRVTEDGDVARITSTVGFHLDGLLSGMAATVLLRGLIGRYADAVLERLRHRIEYAE
ncbi:SRPBCC family protein [Rhodococcus sp. D2-41]|uniref:SRPBCC family protein n=1 Tax=Speluncibacter jeojiensis TaxID=2710754 RepID=A0A9X4M652_9ACTN|nr:SRPBCC family protein [Rhodococcus sp. D2-41]MDG3011326.1 SRPBCC family protein [Rhodococcus sp. D2-41]MDG3016662.1 SRPBCC family protein [Corynebacteriales bacterium D3-21]